MKRKIIKKLIFVLLVVGIVLAIVLPNNNRITVLPDAYPEKTQETITFRGELREVNGSCAFDARCSITIGNKKVTTFPAGDNPTVPKEVGDITEIDTLKEQDNWLVEKKNDSFILVPTRKIEVIAFVGIDENGNYTIFGDNDYYIKLVK